ncbi:MAG: hypothetical protein GEV03_28540 [Streptosporangiales bacterium]|nr:hypothetical protein [Streptosporangiales bacterium]
MSRTLAVVLVVTTSASVLVLEILSMRLVAPYAGLTLETYTASVGVALGAIAVGAALGGRAADAMGPDRIIGPLLVAGGALTMLARPLVLTFGPALRGAGPAAAVILVGLGIAVPVAVLSAVPPAVVKTQLARLTETGTVVGRFSALGTAGALAGTFATGYVLLATLPVSQALLATGILMVGLGAGQLVRDRLVGRGVPAGDTRRGPGVPLLGLTVLGAGLLVAVPSECEVETAYYCARVVPEGETGRVLYLDDLQHSYVDVADPTHLEFVYTERFADVITLMAPRSRPIQALHLGGGGFTIPRWLAATRPGSTSTVLELDPSIVRLARERLGLRTGPSLRVRVGDARTTIATQPADGYDLVVGDAFGGRSVPWHLTTREFVGQVDRVLRPDGVYLLNIIDNPPLAFLAAEIATLRQVFPQVFVLATTDQLAGEDGGNFVVVAGSRAPDPAALASAAAARDEAERPRPEAPEGPEGVATERGVDRLVGDARPLSDDWAPVDQLLTPYVYSDGGG